MIETQTLLIILVGFGIFFGVLFILDIYFLARQSRKKEKEEDRITLEFSKKFLLDLEQMISQEIKKTISEINKKMVEELSEVYQREVSNFSQRAERKMVDFEETTKREVSKITNISSQIQDLILKEIKRKSEELTKGLEEKLSNTYKVAFKDLDQKIFQIEKSIQEYKEERLKEMDRKIYQLVGEVSKKIIGKTIDLSTHEELVFQILEKAKKEIF